MKRTEFLLLACASMYCTPVMAAEPDDVERGRESRKPEAVFVTATRAQTTATKTDTPIVETPQAITVVTDDLYLSQGAISIADTLRYVAGVQANSYGPDTRVDGSFIRGIGPLQFRDGMRDLFSYYASIRSDPYNLSQVEVVRGTASVLFGASSIGGLINMVSKTPQFEPGGEVSVR
jgi:iron complex outermembrane receptor protein